MLYKYLAKKLVYPDRRPVVKNPSDYGMKYHDIAFKSKDGTNLKAWYIITLLFAIKMQSDPCH